MNRSLLFKNCPVWVLLVLANVFRLDVNSFYKDNIFFGNDRNYLSSFSLVSSGYDDNFVIAFDV